MKKIERELTTTQTIYELSEQELEELKKSQRALGRRDIIEYLKFTIGNYHLKINLGGAAEYICDLCDFLKEDKSTIPNTYDYSFHEFVKRYQ